MPVAMLNACDFDVSTIYSIVHDNERLQVDHFNQ